MSDSNDDSWPGVESSPVAWGAHYGCGRKLRPEGIARIGELVTRSQNSALPNTDGLFLLSDAGVSRLGDQLLVQTVDVVLPLPVSPEIWGRATALHCLSDCYAAGGSPISAVGTLEVGTRTDVTEETFSAYAAAVDELNRSGIPLVGGHSLMSQISKMGFTITGVCDPSALRTVASASIGDRVFLTKRIGGGAALGHAAATGHGPFDLDDITSVMLTSNVDAHLAATEAGLRCATDVSGYGLLGALLQVASASQVSISVTTESVPVFTSGRTAVEKGAVAKLAEDLWISTAKRVGGDAPIPTTLLFLDPQVSGGLLLFAQGEQADALELAAHKRRVPLHEIGVVTEPRAPHDVVLD